MRLVLVLAFPLAGCSAVVGSADGTDAQSTSVTGVVVVDRTVGADGTRSEASARFIRLQGAIDDSALKLVGAGLDVPPVGQCASRSEPVSTRPVQLLDVGAVSIESLSSGQRTMLASRQVPDVVDLVSGTMYSARVDETTIPSNSDVTVLVSGSADVPAFSVRARTPDVPTLRVVPLEGNSAELAWTAGRAGDSVYVDVGTTRCTFADDGHAVITAGDGEVIAVHRVRREALSIPGLDAGELRFDFARIVTLHR